MKDTEKSKEQLLNEIAALRQQIQVITEIHESDIRFSTAFNSSPISMSITTYPEGRYISINKSFMTLSGYSSEEIIGRTPSDLKLWVNANDSTNILQALRNKHKIHNVEMSFRLKSGKICTTLYSAENIIIAKRDYILSSVIDISPLKKTETTLRMSEERNHRLLNAIPDLLFRITRSGIYLDYHGSKEHLLYTSPTNFIGKHISKVLPYKIAEKALTYIEAAFTSGNTQVFQYQLSIHDTLYSFEARIVLADENEGLFIVRDITELQQLQNKITRLDQLKLVGEMAASIAHEIRNPMTTVRGFLQLLNGKRECAGFTEYFTLMIEELDRANTIITEFLSLAKNKAVCLESQNLNSVIHSLAPLIQAEATLSNKILKLELAKIPDLLIDAKEIRQLILNLAYNGLEAMPSGTCLMIKTYQDKNEVILAVRDEGYEIKPDLLDKLGTPFITTKDTGTGLGLAVCYSIANRHNAVITIDTKKSGTTFFVRFKQ
jgi:two-component system, sporulation sensor kinase E